MAAAPAYMRPKGAIQRSGDLILVTVGTHHEGFNRLIEPADLLAESLEERMVIQRGSSSYTPRHAEAFQWTTGMEMARLTQEARIIIMHAAAGSALLGLQLGKPLVVVPRLKRYGEHMDDHQQQLARGLSERGQVISVDDPSPESLRAALEAAARLSVTLAGPSQLVANVRIQLEEWNTQKHSANATRKNS